VKVPSTVFAPPRARALLVLVALAMLAVAAPAARAQPPTQPNAPLVWAAPESIDHFPLDALACPSAGECVAVDHNGRVLTTMNLSGGAKTWTSADLDDNNFLTAIACPSSSECVATDNTGSVLSSGDVPAGFGTWSVAADADPSTTTFQSDNAGPTLMRGISCPLVSLCVAVDAAGNQIASTDPTGPPATWVLSHIDTNSTHGCSGGGIACQSPLMGIACPSISLCAAVDFAANVLETGTPLTAAPWSSEPAGGAGFSSLWNVSCPTTSFCASADGYGEHFVTWNPANPTVLTRHALATPVFDVWCQSASLCLGSGPTGHGTDDLVGSLDPTAKRPTWTAMALGGVNAVSCPSATMCVAAGNQGDVSVGVTAASVRALLAKALLPSRSPTIPQLLRRGGETFLFRAAIPGRLTLAWTVPLASGPVVVASASVDYVAAAGKQVHLALTSAGRRLLSGARRLAVTGTATFSTSTSQVSATKRLVLSRGR
jgi:hypothetical protein